VRISISSGARRTRPRARRQTAAPARLALVGHGFSQPRAPGRPTSPRAFLVVPRLDFIDFAAQPESFAVDDDLASGRRKDPDDRPDERDVQLARRASDHHHVGAAGAVDVHHLAERGAVDVGHGRADDLVPVELAARQFLARSDDGFKVGVAQRFGGRSVRHLGEAHAPADRVRIGLSDGERRVAALAKENLSDGKTLVGPVRQRLYSQGSAQPVEAAHLADHEPLSGGHSVRLSRFPGLRSRRRGQTSP
jgi:hypothetical protein